MRIIEGHSALFERMGGNYRKHLRRRRHAAELGRPGRPVASNRARRIRLMHDHIHILPPALMTAQSADESAYHEISAEPLCKLARAQHG